MRLPHQHSFTGCGWWLINPKWTYWFSFFSPHAVVLTLLKTGSVNDPSSEVMFTLSFSIASSTLCNSFNIMSTKHFIYCLSHITHHQHKQTNKSEVADSTQWTDPVGRRFESANHCQRNCSIDWHSLMTQSKLYTKHTNKIMTCSCMKEHAYLQVKS